MKPKANPYVDRDIQYRENVEVDHPPHYTHGSIETIDVIEDWKLNYHIGNAIKYLSRAGKKKGNDEKVDLRKAIWYLNRYLEFLEKKNEKENKTTQVSFG